VLNGLAQRVPVKAPLSTKLASCKLLKRSSILGEEVSSVQLLLRVYPSIPVSTWYHLSSFEITLSFAQSVYFLVAIFLISAQPEL